MLQSLRIRDVVLIQALDLEFHSGLVVLTGETGAGKSILLDSLGLALGERAETSLIRAGAEKAQVTASFRLPHSHPVYTLLKEQEIELVEDQILVRRILTTEGRNKCLINDQPVTQNFLKTVARHLVEIHGQFDNLLDGKYHQRSLDQYGGIDLSPIHQAHGALREAQATYHQATENLENAKDRETFLRFSKEELETLNPKAGEEEFLAQEKSKVAHRAKISEAAQTAAQALAGDQIISPLVSAQKALQKVEEYLPETVTPLVETLERALVEVNEATASVQDLLQDVQGDSLSLEALDDRLHDLRAMARKHHVCIEELSQLLEDYTQELSQLDQGEDHLHLLNQKVGEMRAAYEDIAQKMTQHRQKAASALEEVMAQELPPLKLGQAQFRVDLTRLDEAHWANHGWDRLEFHVSTNPGTPAGPLNKIASGGELSRLMLALKVILSQTTATPTLIFDEIDSGTGGAVAAAIGERLKALSKDMQVLVITHSPQVAALGDQHLQVTKVTEDNQTTTLVHELPQESRMEEVARMLSGSQITAEARAQAKQLMAVA